MFDDHIRHQDLKAVLKLLLHGLFNSFVLFAKAISFWVSLIIGLTPTPSVPSMDLEVKVEIIWGCMSSSWPDFSLEPYEIVCPVSAIHFIAGSQLSKNFSDIGVLAKLDRFDWRDSDKFLELCDGESITLFWIFSFKESLSRGRPKVTISNLASLATGESAMLQFL